MLKNNAQLRQSLWALLAAAALLGGLGFLLSPLCGALVLGSCLVCAGIHLVTEHRRYRALQSFSAQLEALLLRGTPIPIRDYSEGELSILANQIQKLALRLTEAAEASQADKKYLADSLADISHQLRTPLTAMNLTTAMLQKPRLSPEERTALIHELRTLLNRTEWLVETLLKLSKLDAGTVSLAKEAVPVEALIRRAAEPLAIPMELRGISLRVQCGEESFTGDLVWTAEALGNILKNAMEHTPAGGSVTVTARETPLFTQLQVEDTGPGFAPGDIPHLFERFYKGAAASQESCGIGLSLARTVIAAQNGTVQAANTPEGARFVIKFYKQTL